MSIIDIHGKKVHLEEGSRSSKYAVDYLNKLDESEASNFFHTAHTNKYSHFETPRHTNTINEGIQHNMTLEYQNDGTYILRKRTIY